MRISRKKSKNGMRLSTTQSMAAAVNTHVSLTFLVRFWAYNHTAAYLQNHIFWDLMNAWFGIMSVALL